MSFKAFIHLVFLATCALGQAATYKISPAQGHISFTAKGRPALISIKGQGEGVAGILTEKNKLLSGELSFQLTTLKTGIELRDDHLKNKYLEVEKFPSAKLKISELKLENEFPQNLPFKGLLTLHGVEQAIEGKVSVREGESGEKNTRKILAEFKLKISQFKIEIPSFQGITVAEDIQVHVETEATKEE